MAHSTFRVIVRVRPATTHAYYWDVEHGYLHVWLFAATADEAASKAAGVLEALPFERVGTLGKIERHTLPLPHELKRHEEDLQAVGISFLFVGIRTGADDDGFSTELEDRADNPYSHVQRKAQAHS